MPLPLEDLLHPLAGGTQGENLRYSPVYDKIREARQEEEDDTNQGEWQRTRKKADVAAVIKLAADALTAKSKDLQVAVWLSEAAIRKEGFTALPGCLNLLRELQVNFWETLYPELEDGNPEFRATPQEWFAARCDYLLRRIPLTQKGLDWVNYHEAHDTTRERSAMAGRGSDDEKRQARDKAVSEREAAAREFDEAFATTPKSFYITASSHIATAKEALASLETFCDAQYGKVAPNFAKLRDVLEEVSEAVGSLLDEKRQREPDEVPQPEPPPPTEAASAVTDASRAPAIRSASAMPQAEPRTTEEAYAMIARAAESLRKLDTASVTPYLLTRSLRWGELRSAGEPLDLSLLVAPSTEVRQNLKRLFGESNWEELSSATEAAAALPCGRAWLDLHRYAWSALSERGYLASAKAICSELRALISDFPSLPDCMLDDDTPVANPDTKAWLQEHVAPPKPAKEPEVSADLARVALSHQQHAGPKPEANGAASPLETALELTRSGRFSEAVEFLGRQPLPENSGRERFLRQLQTAQLCLGTGQFDIAYPILHDLFSEIEGRKLLEWESTDFVVQPLSLLVRCIDKTSQGTEQRAQIYNLLCRLQPAEALRLQNSGKG